MATKGTVVASFERNWRDGDRFVVQTKDFPESSWRDVEFTGKSDVAIVHAWNLARSGVYEARVIDTEGVGQW